MNNRDLETGRFAKGENTWVERKKANGEMLLFCFSNGNLLFFTDCKDVKQHTWCRLANGYSASQINGFEIPAHRFISKPKRDELVDHINRNKKDNRRCNLRNTNKSINAINAKVRADNKSGEKGVWFRKDTMKWVAEIKKDYKKYSLGCFTTKEEAVAARRDAERRLYGNQF